MSYDVEPDSKGVIHLFVIIEVIQEPYINLVEFEAPLSKKKKKNNFQQGFGQEEREE